MVKNLPAMWVPSLGWEDPPEKGMATPLQYFCLEYPMDRGTWWATVHGVAYSQTGLSNKAQICRWHHPNGRKWGGTKEPLDNHQEESEKAGLKLNIQKTKFKASGPIIWWQTDGEKMETVTDYFLGLQNHWRWWFYCNHEIKRCLLPGRKAMTNIDSILKSRDITLPKKEHIVKAVVFQVAMYRCESWTIKKAEHWRINVFKLQCWRSLLRVPWTARISKQSIPKDINSSYSLEGLMLKLKLQTFGYLMQRANSLQKTLMLGKTEGRKRIW